MLKWFSISGILKEVKRIRWPHGKTLATNSLTVIVFTATGCAAFGAVSLPWQLANNAKGSVTANKQVVLIIDLL